MLIIMNLGIIRNLCEKRAGGMRQLASDIGMSEANLHRCVNNNKIQASDLEQIALKLRVDIRSFFDVMADGINAVNSAIATGSGNANNNVNIEVPSNTDAAILAERVKSLEALVAEKERLIKVYEKMLK